MFLDILVGVLGNAAYDIVKGLASEIFGSDDDDQIAQALGEAFESATKRFFQRYGARYSNPHDSFLGQSENWKAVRNSMRYGADSLATSDLNPEGPRGGVRATEEELRYFVQVLEEEIRENRDLERILEQKGSMKQIREIHKKQIEETTRRAKVFLSGKRFFQKWLDSDRLFHHAWELVGRRDYLTQLDEFMKSPKLKVALMVGRGGIGKTKILHAYSEEFKFLHEEWDLRFVEENVPLTPDSLLELANLNSVIVIDDAHRYEDLRNLLSMLQQREKSTKIILSARPQAIDHLMAQLTHNGFDVRQILRLPDITNLSIEEMEDLALQTLGEEAKYSAERLARLTKDAPLVTVVAGTLLREKHVDPLFLEQDDEFRQEVLRRFKDISIGRISTEANAELYKNLLQVISAITPCPLESKAVLELIAAFLGVEQEEVIRLLADLQSAGILVRRGMNLRITPDVLSDHILHEACLTPQGVSTGFIQKIYRAFGNLLLSKVLRNFAELDWRIASVHEKEPELLKEIWEEIENKLMQASHYGRVSILDTLKDAAYYQPRYVLALVAKIMRNPSTNDQNDSLSDIFAFTNDHVLRHLPELLRRIGYSLQYLPRCCDLLWKLGRGDNRNLDQYPEHAIRVLQDMASYGDYKPLAYNEVIVSALEKWAKSPDADTYFHSYLDIADRLLVKSGSSTFSRGVQFNIRPFLIDSQATQLIRERVFCIIEEDILSLNTKRVLRAITSLEQALRNPTGQFGMKITEEISKQWFPEQLYILNMLNRAVKSTDRPLVHLAIRDAVSWHCMYEGSLVQERARKLFENIPKPFEYRLVEALCNNHQFSGSEEGDFEHWYRVSEEKKKEQLIATKIEFLLRYPTPMTGMETLEKLLAQIKGAGVSISPVDFLLNLSTGNSKYTSAMCMQILTDQSVCEMKRFFGTLLYAVRDNNLDESVQLVIAGVQTKDPDILWSIAQYLRHICGHQNIQEEEVVLIQELLRHHDVSVKHTALETVTSYANLDPLRALEFALETDIGTDSKLAKQVAVLFDKEWGVQQGVISDEHLRLMLKKLLIVENLEAHQIQKFLKLAAKRIPQSVVEFFIKRVKLVAGQDFNSKYDPIPSNIRRLTLEGLRDCEKYKDLLREVRDLSLLSPPQESYYYPDLFELMSLNYSQESLEVLEEWVHSGVEEKIAQAAHLLKEAHYGLIFQQSEFISRLLESSDECGDECYQSVKSSLFACAFNGMKSGIAGEPNQRDVSTKNQADECAARFDPGSPTEQFYSLVSKHAQDNIQTQLAYEEGLLDN